MPPKKRRPRASTPKPKKSPEPVEDFSAPDNVLYVEADEEVMSVIDRIKHVESDEVFIVIPNRALMLQSVVNLKLLKKEGESSGLAVHVVTTDRKGMNLASQVGLTVYHDLKSRLQRPVTAVRRTPSAAGFSSAAVERSSTDAEGMVEPTSEQAMHELPVAPRSRKSFNEYMRGVVGGTEKLKRTSRSPDGSQSMDVAAFVSASPNRRILTFFIAAAGFLAIVIAYFVLPQATVYVQAKSFVERPIERVTLADAAINEAELRVNDDAVIASYPIETEIELTKSYSATGVTSTGTDARGEVIIFNDSASTQPLIRSTRLRSPDGLIFRIQNEVIIPARASANVEVVADKLDEAGQVIGERGNLGPTRFILPGLAGSNKELVYAKNIDPFTGGKTNVSSIVQAQDIEAARTNIVEELKGVARQKLQSRLENENKTRDAQLAFLETDDALQVDVVEVRVVGDIKEGDVVSEFQVYGKIKVFGITYDKREVVNILDRKLRTFIHPDQELASVDPDSLKMEFVSFDDNKKTKVNASMNYRLKYTISDDMVDTIKERIVGKGIQEAESYVQSLDQVGEVQIKTWPFWVRTIPGVAWNVSVEEAEDIE